MISKVGTIDGKNISVYKPRSGKQYRSVDIAKFIKRFQLNETLRLIGEVSSTILMDDNPEPIRKIDNVPISDSLLAYLAMMAIENSNDYRSKPMTLKDLAKAADMYFGLPEPFLSDSSLDSFLVRFGAAQFDYDREINNIVPRTFLIYCRLWDQVPEASNLDIESALLKISGLKLEEVLILGFAYFGASNKGFFRIYNEAQISHIDKQFFTLEKQRSFLSWLSCTYKQFRGNSLTFQRELPHPYYEKNRFNMLTKYPIIIPDRNPTPQSSKPYIVPIRRLLIERITRGLYFDLADFFKETSKANEFREAFGHVFQAYVGLIMKESKRELKLLPDWKYGKPEKRTPDWIILEGNKAVIIEVKQSGLFLPAKTSGDVEAIRASLLKTINEAIRQFWSFEKDLRSCHYYELEQFSDVIEIERLLITYDRTYFSNSVLMKHALQVAQAKMNDMPEDFHIHVCSVEEFEYVLALDFSSLFEILREKRNDKERKDWDFREYCSRKFEWQGLINHFLTKIKSDFIEHVETTLNKPNK